MNQKMRRCRWTAPRLLAFACLGLLGGSGCWAPLRSDGIRASELPDSYRQPRRTAGAPINFANLTSPAHGDYLLGPGDSLDVSVHELYPGAEIRPLHVRVMANGEIHLPLVGAVRVAGMNLLQANKAITSAYADGFLPQPRVNLTLAEKNTMSIVVLGEVRTPGVQRLPRYENDVAHALAAAGGLAEDAADEIEIHRRRPASQKMCRVELGFDPFPIDADPELQLVGLEQASESPEAPSAAETDTWAASTRPQQQVPSEEMEILRIPLRGAPVRPLGPDDVSLVDGDIVVVPSRKSEIFFVVGKLSPTNFVRFNIGARERDLGAGFLLPRDREIDVVTAVVMAGYIDPIDSPTTVTVHRVCPDGQPMLVKVDLIKARYDRCENLIVEAGDIIYLNPDCPWWFRRTVDRVIDNFGLSFSYRLNSRGGGK